jgi:flagellar motor switch protein FliM
MEHVSSEINPQFAQIADEHDLVVLTRFEAESAAQGSGFIDLVTPYVSLKPVRDLLRSRVQSGDGNDESDKVWRIQLADAVHDASVEARILLGKAHVSLSQMRQLKPGDVLPFKKTPYARAIIRDIPTFDVEVGTSAGQVAVRIVDAVSVDTTPV